MRKHTSVIFFCLAIICTLRAHAQHTPVIGKVTDEKGEPVPFATVRWKDGKSSTVADQQGNFTLNAAKDALLIISAAGFTSEQTRVGEGPLSIQLKRLANLQEAIVTALGIRRSRNSLPYATQQITGDDVNRVPNTNFVDNLSGKVAGLQITQSNTTGGTNNVILRGLKSLTQSNQALFVVDGVPYDNTNQSQNGYDLGNAASDINPEDIESISVLKGAAASALYGSRASNGVILITTKRSKRKDRGIGVSFNSSVTVGSPDKTTLPTYQTQYGEGYGSQGYNPGYPAQSGFFYYVPVFNSNGQPVNVVQTDVDAATGPAYNPSLLVYNWDAFVPGDPNYGKATPWQPAPHHNPVDFFQTPVTTINSVYADGGSEDGTFKAGYTHSQDNGLLPNSTLTKNLFTFGATRNLTDKLTLGGQVNYSDVAGVGRDGYIYSSQENPLMDFREWWPTNVNLKAQKADYFRDHTNESWNWLGDYTQPSTLIPAYHNNTYWNRYQNFEDDDRTRYFGNVNLNYKVLPYLSVLGRVSLDSYDQFVEYHTAIGSVHQSSYTRSNASYKETNYDLLVNFDKKLTTDIGLRALLGGNIRQAVNTSILATTNGGLVVPGLYTLANSVLTPNAPSEYDGTKEVDGVFAGATLSWRDLVTLDGTLRRDKSSTLPVAHDTYYYPSVSGNFVFSRLLSGLQWLSYGKLRANYAEVGGDAPLFSVQNTFQNVNPFNGETLFAAPVVNNNPNLLPETNRTYELGLEAAFFGNRLGFDLTYYHAQEINQIMPVNVSTASGYSQFFVNGGTVQNEGYELSVTATPIRQHGFSWDIALNWSSNRNKVLSLYGGQPSYEVASYGFNTQLVAEVGKSYGIIRGSDYQYLHGKPLVNANGYYLLNPNALSDIGNINPNWIGGITNTFKYKDVALSFLVDMRQGGQLYSLDMDFGDYSGLYPETAGKNSLGNPVRSPLSQGGGVVFPGVTADGKPNATRVDASDINQGLFPFSSYNNLADRSYVYDASYIKLREVALTYSVPRKTIQNLNFIKGIDLSLTGRNLWIIHKNEPYADPEQGYASLGSGTGVQNASQGFQVGVYPSVRTFGFNLKLKF
jgi:TonB-linked SusC/RagA family outer membrane protein